MKICTKLKNAIAQLIVVRKHSNCTSTKHQPYELTDEEKEELRIAIEKSRIAQEKAWECAMREYVVCRIAADAIDIGMKTYLIDMLGNDIKDMANRDEWFRKFAGPASQKLITIRDDLLRDSTRWGELDKYKRVMKYIRGEDDMRRRLGLPTSDFNVPLPKERGEEIGYKKT